MESQSAVHPVSDREQNTPLHKCNDKYIQYDRLWLAQKAAVA